MNLKKILFVMTAIMAVTAIGLTPASARGNKNANKITIAGSTTVLPISQKAAEVFMQNNPGINVSVRGGGSSIGIAGVIDNTINIGDASRKIKNKEVSKAKANGRNVQEFPIAKDGLAIIVNLENGVNELSVKQIADIFTGKIDNWSQVGGANLPIVPISRDTSSGTFETFITLVLKGGKVKEGALMLAANSAVESAVSTTPGAIGYIGVGFISDKIKVLSVEGVMASAESVKNGSYKLNRYLYMYTPGVPTGNTKKFLDFVLSPEGQKIVDEVGYVSVK